MASNIGSTEPAPTRPIELTVGGFLERALRIWGENWVAAAVCAICLGIPYSIINLLSQDARHKNFIVSLALMIVGLVMNQLVTAMLMLFTMRSLQGKKASFGEAQQLALKRFFPLLGTSMLYGFIIAIGILLLIIPGIIFGLWYAVAIPVAVMESKSGMGALERSKELTDGYRGPIAITFFVVSVVALLVGMLPTMFLNSALTPLIGGVGVTILSTVVQLFLGTVSSVLMCTIYFALRTKKEGLSVSALEDVFA